MRHLFSAEGQAELASLVAQRPLLAFDFDGTLAPIVARPAQARVPVATLQRLRLLSPQLPLAVISGRSLADLRRRLGFEPAHVVGSHGAEDPHHAHTVSWTEALDGMRQRLRAAAAVLRAAGVSVEDKGASLALHYRLASDTAAALAAIESLLQPADPGLRVFGGKMVINIVAAGAEDKAGAVRRLVQRTHVQAVLYLGDDVNDEPVFAAGEASWLSVRVGAHDESAARYFIHGPQEVPHLLDLVLTWLGQPMPR